MHNIHSVDIYKNYYVTQIETKTLMKISNELTTRSEDYHNSW